MNTISGELERCSRGWQRWGWFIRVNREEEEQRRINENTTVERESEYD